MACQDYQIGWGRAVAAVAVRVDEAGRPALVQAKWRSLQLELSLILGLAKSSRASFDDTTYAKHFLASPLKPQTRSQKRRV